MKTRLFLAALAGVALASCVTDKEYDVPAQNENVKIAFDSPVMYDNDTRANYHGEIGTITYGTAAYTYPRTEDFQIFAVQHPGNFTGWASATSAPFNNTPIKYDDQIDGWAPKDNGQYYHWPIDQEMSFAACSPADMEIENNGATRGYGPTGLSISGFQIPTDATRHFDLMFSKRTVNITSADMNHGASYYSGVPIQFQHALSSIHFSLSNKSSENVVLTKISLYGVYDTGSFSEGITEDTDDYAKYERGTNVNPAWEVNTSAGASKVSADTPYIAFEGELAFPTEPQYISVLLTQPANAGNTSKNRVLLPMPQDIPNSGMLRVEYRVNGSPAFKELQLNTAVYDKTDNKITTWEIGKKYTYRLYYSAESASQDKIYFSPSSEGWTDAGVGVIELKN